MSDDIKKLKVVIEADASRYKKALEEAKRDTREGVSSIQNAVKKNLDLDVLNTNGIKSKLADVKRQISDTFGNIRSIAGLDNLENPFTNLVQNMRASKKEAMLDSGQLSFTPDYQSAIDGIERMNKALAKYKQQESDFSAAGVPYESEEWAKVQGKIYDAENALKSYKSQKKELEASGGDVMKTASLGSSLSGKAGGISNAFGKIKNAFSSIGSGAKTAFSGASATIKKFGSLFSGVIKGARGLGSYMSGGLLSHFRLFGRGGGGALSGIGSGFKNILKYAIGIRSLFVLTNRLRSAVTEGMKNLALYDETGSVNKNLSLLMSSLTQLKNAWGAAFKPILEVVTPYLNTLIQGLVGATNRLAQFFSALTGHKTATQAIKINQNYAASLNNSASSAKKATEETKKYQNQLYGFDEINKADKADSVATTDNSNASSGVNPSDMFDEKGIESNVKSLADKIKDAWQKADFSGIGTMVAGKINSALASIPWGKIQETCNRAAGSLATFINGITAGTNWGLIGQTVANGVNTVAGAVHQFFSMTDWYSLGDGIGKSIQSSFDNIDWTTLGKSLTDGIRALSDTVHGILQELDFSKIGTDIGTMINAGLQNIPWEQGISDVVQGATGIFTALSKAIDEIDWKGLTQRISDGLNGADWSGLGTSISDAISSALQGGIDILEGFDWEGFGADIIQFITSINWLDLLMKGWEGIVALGTAIPRMIGGAIEKTDWASVGDSIINALQNFDWSGTFSRVGNLIGLACRGLIDLIVALVYTLPKTIIEAVGSYFDQQIDEAGGNIVLGIFNGIKNAIVNIGEWIYNNIFKPFIDGFKSAFGIHSPASTMAEPGQQIIAGVLSGITDKFKDVVTFFTGLPGKIKDAIGDAKDWLKEKGSNIVSGLKDGINGQEKSFKSRVTKLKDAAKNALSGLKKAGSDVGGKLVKGLKKSISPKAISNHMKKCVTVIKTAFSGLKKIGEKAGKALANGIKSIHISLPHISTKGSHTFKIGGKEFSIPKISVKWYAGGGMPDVGQMFIAREAGPELVGSIGNHNAVMNNNQIVDAVSEGVFKAVISAMDRAYEDDRNTGDIVLTIDGAEVARAVNRANKNNRRRYNPAVVV